MEWSSPTYQKITVSVLIDGEVTYYSRPLMSNMRLRRIGPITTGSRVRDTISYVFVPHYVGANAVRLRHGTTKLCNSLEATTKIPPL